MSGSRPRAAWEAEALAQERELFARHDVFRRRDCGRRWTLMARMPDGRWLSDRWFEVVVLDGDGLLAQGDIDLAAWEGLPSKPGRPPRDVVAWVARKCGDLHSAAQKATRSIGALAVEHVGEVMRGDLERLLEPEREISKAQRRRVSRALAALSADSSADACRDIARSLYDYDVVDAEEACSLGVATSHRVLTGLAAVARLNEILTWGRAGNEAWLQKYNELPVPAEHEGHWGAVYEGCVAFVGERRQEVDAWVARQEHPREAVVHAWPTRGGA